MFPLSREQERTMPDFSMAEREIDPTAARLGVPPDKFGLYAQPLRTADRRQAVMLMVFPPEELRDQPLPVVEAVLMRQGDALLRTIALEIYKSYTSEPVDQVAARMLSEALAAHADSMRTGT